MKYQPHPLRRADDAGSKRSVRRLLGGDDEISRRAIADAEQSFQKVRDELRRLVQSADVVQRGGGVRRRDIPDE